MKKKRKNSKSCSRCKKVLPLSLFYTSRHQSDGYQAYCRECDNIIRREKYPFLNVEKRRESSRRRMLMSKYGMSLEEYQEMFDKQKGVCAICHRPETSHSNKKGPVDSLRVDHCHITGTIRGLLCSECNFGISKFDDNMGSLSSALLYILKFKQGLKYNSGQERIKKTKLKKK